MTPVRPNGLHKILRFVYSKINELFAWRCRRRSPDHKCKPLAKRLGEMRRSATKALNLCASLPEGGPGWRSPGWINNARSNLDPFKLALMKTELKGRVDRRLLSRV